MSADLKETDRKFALGIRRNLRAGVTSAGSDIVAAVKAGASWSSRIPEAVKVTTQFRTKGASVRIQVDHNAAPHARPLELGNKTTFALNVINQNGGYRLVNGRRVAVNRNVYNKIRQSGIGLGRALRHPVFDSKKPPTRVGEQPTRPFFFPAIAKTAAGIDLKLEAVIVKAALDAGFK
jgi:hypothetical protein